MTKRKLVLALLWSLALPAAAQGEKLADLLADPAALKTAAEAGKKAAFFCANCHGDDGVSNLPEVPNLAGQNPSYLLEQIRKFGSGQRKDQFMQGLIKVLSEKEKMQIAVFYAGQKPAPSKVDAVQAGKGKEIFTKLCARCHGEQAHGNELIPRLAGQHKEYLVTSVTRYRDKTGERQDPLMSSAVAPLKNEDIAAAAAYLSSLP